MKAGKRSIWLALIMYLATGVMGSVVPMLIEQVHAAPIVEGPGSPQFAWGYSPDGGDVNKMSHKLDDDDDDPVFKKSYIVARNGWFGDGMKLSYSGYVDNYGLSYTYSYDCVDGLPTKSAPSSSVDSHHITVAVILDGPGKDFDTQTTVNAQFFVTAAQYNPKKLNDGTKQKDSVEQHNKKGLMPSEYKKVGAPDTCLITPFGPNVGKFLSPIPNITAPTTSQTVKDDWKGTLDTIAAAGAAGGGGAGGAGGAGAAGTDPDSECAANSFGFGWITCAMINTVTDTFAKPYQKFVLSELKVDPYNASVDPTNPSSDKTSYYLVWNNLRILANVMFALIFMFIIFANVLGINLNAYAIKKMIPKLVAAAVLVQFSFVISAAVIDIGNILGDGIAQIVNSAVPGTGGKTAPAAMSAVGDIIVLGVGVGAVAAVGIVTVMAFALGAMISFITMVLTLVFHGLVLTVMVVFSSLGIAAMVLPSTEKFYKMWYSNLIKATLMYPIIAILFSLAAVLSKATESRGSTGDFEHLIAAGFPIIACILLPTTWAMGGGLFNKGQGMIQGYGGKSRGAAVGGFKGSRGAQAANARRKDRKEAGLEHAIEAGGFKGYVAGVRTRGAVLPGNRSLERNKGGPWYKPVTTKGDRAQVLAREQATQASRIHAHHVEEAMDTMKGYSPDQLLAQLQDKNSNMTQTQKEAAVKLAVKGKAGDQSAFFAALTENMSKSTPLEKKHMAEVVSQARAVDYGNILTSNPLMAKMNMEDKVDAAGNVISRGDEFVPDPTDPTKRVMNLSQDTAAGIHGLSADKLANMTNQGWKSIATAQVDRSHVTAMHTKAVADGDTAKATELATVLSSGKAFFDGHELISERAKIQLRANTNLASKVIGTDNEKYI